MGRCLPVLCQSAIQKVAHRHRRRWKPDMVDFIVALLMSFLSTILVGRPKDVYDCHVRNRQVDKHFTYEGKVVNRTSNENK